MYTQIPSMIVHLNWGAWIRKRNTERKRTHFAKGVCKKSSFALRRRRRPPKKVSDFLPYS